MTKASEDSPEEDCIPASESLNKNEFTATNDQVYYNDKLSAIELLSVKSADDPNLMCGIGSFRPQWLQKFAHRKVYLVVYCMVGIIQGMMYTYFTSVISTLEKRFGIKSEYSGIVMTGNEVSQILFSIFLTYYGGRGHRPKWLALGLCAASLSCFIMALPHLLFGEGDLVDVAVPSERLSSAALLSDNVADLLCDESRDLGLRRSCEEQKNMESLWAMILLFLGQFISGIGTTTYYVLGITYLDDNVKKAESPFMFGITYAFRILGPTLGYLLGAGCLQFYINLSQDVGITPKHPNWVGAWWLGFLILCFLLLVIAVPMRMFPERLLMKEERKALREASNLLLQSNLVLRQSVDCIPTTLEPSEMNQRSLADLKISLKRILQNKLIIFMNLSGVLHLFGLAGFWTFSPKYMETQFNISASKSSFLSGLSAGIQVVGCLVSGWLIGRFRPRTSLLTGWTVISSVFQLTGFITLIYVGCPPLNYYDHAKGNKTLEISNSCNRACRCTMDKFSPVCFRKGEVNYYSPCFAGCHLANETDDKLMYYDCSCTDLHPEDFVESPGMFPGGGPFEKSDPSVASGLCSTACTLVWTYLSIVLLTKLISSTGRVGNMLLFMRCVEEKDKPLAMGIITTTLSIFAWIPYSIVYGSIIDSTCLIWKETPCGKPSNCAVYDTDLFRYYLHAVTAGLFGSGLIFDVLLWHHSKRLPLWTSKDADQL